MGLLVRIAVVVLAAVAVGAASAKPPARIVFPLIGPAVFTDDFGDGRSQGAHEGNDILAARRALAVAAEAGTVRFWTSAQAGCMLYLYGASGTTYLYIHLNNDRGSGNDNRGSCLPGTAYASGLKDGEAVAAGQLIGFVGDSGDADGLHPHLHFELHPGGGAAVSPYRWLRKAQHLAAAA
jgi:murein DD-endopeptidase MepM/ murein hydrolase activator NlpD